MCRSEWEILRNEYGRRTGLPNYVVEYLSVYPIIKYAAQGMSNNWISKKLDLPEEYVEDVCILYLDFTGWLTNLDYSPIYYFDLCDNKYVLYEDMVLDASSVGEGILHISFNIAKVYSKLRKVIKQYE